MNLHHVKKTDIGFAIPGDLLGDLLRSKNYIINNNRILKKNHSGVRLARCLLFKKPQNAFEEDV